MTGFLMWLSTSERVDGWMLAFFLLLLIGLDLLSKPWREGVSDTVESNFKKVKKWVREQFK